MGRANAPSRGDFAGFDAETRGFRASELGSKAMRARHFQRPIKHLQGLRHKILSHNRRSHPRLTRFRHISCKMEKPTRTSRKHSEKTASGLEGAISINGNHHTL
jgi:hypothetical protein